MVPPITNFVRTLSIGSVIFSTTQARIHPRDVYALEARDEVTDVFRILLALRNTAFCSSFGNLRDVTKTATVPGTLVTTTTVVTAPSCITTAVPGTFVSVVETTISPRVTETSTLEPNTITLVISLPTPTVSSTTTVDATPIITTETLFGTETSTTTTFVTTANIITIEGLAAAPSSKSQSSSLLTRPPSPSSSKASTSMSQSPLQATQAPNPGGCELPGLPLEVRGFLCEHVFKACSKLMRPKSSTVTVTGSARTSTVSTTASPLCQTQTPAPGTTVQIATVTLPPTTLTETISSPDITSTTYTTPEAVTNILTITNPPTTTTITTALTLTEISTSTIAVPNSQCTPGTRGFGGFFQTTFNVNCDSYCSSTFGGWDGGQSTQPNFPACASYCVSDNRLTGLILFNKLTGDCQCDFFPGNGPQADPRFDCASRT